MKRNGFTLVELVVVVGIIILILSIVTSGISRIYRDAVVQKTYADIRHLIDAESMVKSDIGYFVKLEYLHLAYDDLPVDPDDPEPEIAKKRRIIREYEAYLNGGTTTRNVVVSKSEWKGPYHEFQSTSDKVTTGFWDDMGQLINPPDNKSGSNGVPEDPYGQDYYLSVIDNDPRNVAHPNPDAYYILSTGPDRMLDRTMYYNDNNPNDPNNNNPNSFDRKTKTGDIAIKF
jgi:type II secretory pathway pseudopilin PulG